MWEQGFHLFFLDLASYLRLPIFELAELIDRVPDLASSLRLPTFRLAELVEQGCRGPTLLYQGAVDSLPRNVTVWAC